MISSLLSVFVLQQQLPGSKVPQQHCPIPRRWIGGPGAFLQLPVPPLLQTPCVSWDGRAVLGLVGWDMSCREGSGAGSADLWGQMGAKHVDLDNHRPGGAQENNSQQAEARRNLGGKPEMRQESDSSGPGLNSSAEPALTCAGMPEPFCLRVTPVLHRAGTGLPILGEAARGVLRALLCMGPCPEVNCDRLEVAPEPAMLQIEQEWRPEANSLPVCQPFGVTFCPCSQ